MLTIKTTESSIENERSGNMKELDFEKLRLKMKSARVGAGLTQDDVAEKLGIHRQTIVNWENHPEKMSFEKLKVLANLYGITSTDFFM